MTEKLLDTLGASDSKDPSVIEAYAATARVIAEAIPTPSIWDEMAFSFLPLDWETEKEWTPYDADFYVCMGDSFGGLWESTLGYEALDSTLETETRARMCRVMNALMIVLAKRFISQVNPITG